MGYLGNSPENQAFTPRVDYFSGNASATAFTLSFPVASVAQVQAVIENVPQNPGDAYTVSGNTITFTSAPPSGTNNIYVYYTSPITQVGALPQSPQIYGNLQFNSPGARITGDFSGSPTANRVFFETSTANTSTTLGIKPNGTGTNANFGSYSNSLTNGSVLFMGVTNGATEARFNSTISGTGSYLPITMYTGGSERMRIDTSGNVGIGTSSPSSYGKLGVISGVNYFGVASDIYTSAKFGPRPSNDGTVTVLHEYGGHNSGSYWKTDASSGSFGLYRIGTVVTEWDSSSNFKFNSGYGSAATAYGCRAWVKFNGTGTVAINGSGNVSSITDNGTGDYTVNFTAAMPDNNYSATLGGNGSGSNDGAGRILQSFYSTGTYLSTSVRLSCLWAGDGSTREDKNIVTVAVFR